MPDPWLFNITHSIARAMERPQDPTAMHECAICLAEIQKDDEITTLCNHTFHVHCYLSSLKFST
jgi:RING-like zinc finger